MADTTLFAEVKEPRGAIQHGNEILDVLCTYARTALHRTMPLHAARVLLAFAGCCSKFHAEQCTLAEFSAYVIRDVISHMELAAEARIKKPSAAIDAGTVEENVNSENEAPEK